MPKPKPIACPSSRSRRAQLGAFSILELIFALVISSLLSVYALRTTIQQAEDLLASSTSAYLVAATSAAQRYSLTYFDTLQLAAPTIAGFAAPFAPTMAELKTAGILSASFSDFTPSQQAVRFDFFKTGTCPGVTCTITGMACLTTPFAVRGNPREDLTTGVMSGMKGQGGRSQIGAGNIVRGSGAFIQTVNPLGNVEGIVCGQDVLDASLYDRFVKMNETRDVNIKGNLTVDQNLGAGKGTDAGGNSCTLGAILSSGQVLTRSASCIRLAWMGQDALGNGQIGVADSSGRSRLLLNGDGTLISLDAAGTAKAGIKSVAGQMQVFGDSVSNNAGSATVASDGTVTATNVVTSALTLNNTASIGAACSPDGSASWANSAGRWTFVRCSGGVWTSVGGAVGAVVGSACNPYGAKALDASGAELMCTGGQWQLTTSRLGRYVLYATYNVFNADMVWKPTCTSGSTNTAAYMSLGSETITKFERANRYLQDNGSYWTVNLFDEYGVGLDSANVLVLTYCVY